MFEVYNIPQRSKPSRLYSIVLETSFFIKYHRTIVFLATLHPGRILSITFCNKAEQRQ